jgi:Ca2+-binding EF-hand superfamily protein
MKKINLTSLLAVATLFLSAQAIAQPADQPEDAGRRGPHLKKLDLNQDGKIDETERAVAEQQMRARLTENPRMLARVDTDQDGQISDDEWAVAKAKFNDMRQKRLHSRKDRDEWGPGKQGPRDPEFHRGYLLGKYDANGDHQLDETERAAIRTDMETKMRTGMEKQLARLKAVDTDNDGKISDAEWAVAKTLFKDEHPGFAQHGPKGPRGPGMMPPPPPED